MYTYMVKTSLQQPIGPLLFPCIVNNILINSTEYTEFLCIGYHFIKSVLIAVSLFYYMVDTGICCPSVIFKESKILKSLISITFQSF